MTNIEFQFMESGIRFFRDFCYKKSDKPEIDWEMRRYEAAVQILSGIYANSNKKYPGSVSPADKEEVENAVILADILISILKNRSFICDEHYQR